MSKKVTLQTLPPGHYSVKIDRVRKVRNKPYKRIHMIVIETGDHITEVIKP